MNQFPKPPTIEAAGASNELNQRMLGQLATTAEACRAELPEFVGMTVYGSLSRGEAQLGSDADIFVFMQPTDSLGSLQNNPNVDDLEKVQLMHQANHSGYEFHGGIGLDYKMRILEKLQQAGIETADIDVAPLNQEVIQQSVDLLLAATERHEPYSPAPVRVPRNLRGLFHKPVDGQQLQPFIRQALQGLAASPFGEQAWARLRHQVIGFEMGRQGNHEQPPRYLAPTLQEALADINQYIT